jgi:glucose-6-phosphate isomerase
MTDRLALDYSGMLAPTIGERGIAEASLDLAATRFREVHAAIAKQRAAGTLGFLELTGQTDVAERIRSFADGVGQAFDTIVVLGIGGSALGTIALQRALLRPFWNELDDEGRDYYPRLYVLDNVDPTTIGPLFDRLDPGRTLFNVISKSGATAETMSQFLIARARLMDSLDDAYRRHIIFTTDPERGVLRKLADGEAIPTFSVPPNVGGRFSVLSAVGLLPAALVGIDIEAMLRGAAAMDERCRTADLFENPAGLFGVLQHLAHVERNAPIHVVMPYSDRLGGIADWFRQLWAESLGKRLDRTGAEVFRGPTPVSALGATDQHSQMQLYMEGPFDKTITFLAARERPFDLDIPAAYPDIDALAYLGGHTLGGLLDAERHATSSALSRSGRMNMTIEVARVDAEAIGEILMMFEIATVYAGELYGIDPLDQPGVELGKTLTYGLMGRQGFAPEADDPTIARRICS